MHIVRVAPLAALPNTVPQVLDYFWNAPLPQGAVVRVIVGHRGLTALVLESMPLEQAKLSVKKSDFGLKKVNTVITESPQATTQQISLARTLARQYHAPLGMCLKTVLPSFIGARGRILDLPPTPTRSKRTPEPHTLILTQPDTARAYIAEHLSVTDGQLLVIVPEITLAKYLAEQFDSEQIALIHSDLSVKNMFTEYRRVMTGQARVVIGTRVALFLPFADLNHIIVEDPLHEAYKSDMTPRYNAPDVARMMSEMYHASVTYLSPAMSTANTHAVAAGVLHFTDRKPYWPQCVYADMAAEQQSGNRSILSRAVQEAILDAYDERRPILLFSPRRAYSTTVVCTHCRMPVLCATCAIPLRLHRTTEHMLVCYHCTAFLRVPKQCPSCKAGTLHPAGLAGSQKIAEAVGVCLDRHGLTKIKVPILDSDLVRTDEHERTILEQFDAMPHPMLVATQMIFSHRYTRSFTRIAVIEADALGYSPDFRAQERLVYQLEKLVDFHPSTLYLQSLDRSGALAHAQERSWNTLYAQELSERKVLGWPPFSRLTKLSYATNDRTHAERAARTLAERLTRAAAHLGITRTVSILGPMPALLERAGGRWTHHILLKSTGTSPKIASLLDHVPTGWTIDIDPRSIT